MERRATPRNPARIARALGAWTMLLALASTAHGQGTCQRAMPCAGFSMTAATCTGAPTIGTSFTIHALRAGLVVPDTAFLILGDLQVKPIASLAIRTCSGGCPQFYVRPLTLLAAPPTPGTLASWTFSLPNQPALIGAVVHAQTLGYFPALKTGKGVTGCWSTDEPLAITIG